MKRCSSLGAVLVIFAISVHQISGGEIDEGMMEGLTKALEAGRDTLDILAKEEVQDMIKAFKNIKEWSVPLVGALADIANIFGSFLGDGESEELKYLKEQFGLVNNKLDSLEYNFGDIKDLVDWTNLNIKYSSYETTIHYLKEKLTLFINAPIAIQPMLKDQFVLEFTQHYKDSGAVLFNGLMRNQLFSQTIVSVVRQHTKDHRTKTLKFIYSVSQLLITAMQLEVTFHAFKKEQLYLNRIKADWATKMEEVQKIVRETDDAIVSRLEENYRSTLTELVIKNQNKKGTELAQYLFNELSDKFDWRDWYVVVATENDADPSDIMKVENCGPGDETRYKYYGSHIIVNHGNKKAAMDKGAAEGKVNGGERLSRGDDFGDAFKTMYPDCNKFKIFVTIDPHRVDGFSVYASGNNYVSGTVTYKRLDPVLEAIWLRRSFKRIVVGTN